MDSPTYSPTDSPSIYDHSISIPGVGISIPGVGIVRLPERNTETEIRDLIESMVNDDVLNINLIKELFDIIPVTESAESMNDEVNDEVNDGVNDEVNDGVNDGVNDEVNDVVNELVNNVVNDMKNVAPCLWCDHVDCLEVTEPFASEEDLWSHICFEHND